MRPLETLRDTVRAAAQKLVDSSAHRFGRALDDQEIDQMTTACALDDQEIDQMTTAFHELRGALSLAAGYDAEPTSPRDAFEASLIEILAELAENTRRIAEALERRNPLGVPTGRVDLAKSGGAP